MYHNTWRVAGFTGALLLLCGSAFASGLQSSAGDFNKDGKTDLVVLRSRAASGYRTQYQLELFESGRTAPTVVGEFYGDWQSRVVVRDVDGDHDSDVVLLSATGVATRAWINDGLGHLESSKVEPSRASDETTSFDSASPAATRAGAFTFPTAAPHCQPVFRTGVVPQSGQSFVRAALPRAELPAWFHTFNRPPPSISLL